MLLGYQNSVGFIMKNHNRALCCIATGFILFAGLSADAKGYVRSFSLGNLSQLPVVFNSDSVTIGTSDLGDAPKNIRNLKIVSLNNGSTLSTVDADDIPQPLRGRTSGVFSVFSEATRSELITTGTLRQGIVSVWNMKTGKALWHQELAFTFDQVTAAQVSDDGTKLVGCGKVSGPNLPRNPIPGSLSTCALYDSVSGLVKTLVLNENGVTTKEQTRSTVGRNIRFTEDGRYFVLERFPQSLAATRKTPHVAVYDATTGSLVRAHDGYAWFGNDQRYYKVWSPWQNTSTFFEAATA